MITRQDVTIENAIASLRSTICPACGGRKGPRKSLCYEQFMQLPSGLRSALYARVGGGYEEALLDALRHLEARTLHLPKET